MRGVRYGVTWQAAARSPRHLVGQFLDLEALELGVVAGVADADRLLDDVERERERGELPEVGPCRGRGVVAKEETVVVVVEVKAARRSPHIWLPWKKRSASMMMNRWCTCGGIMWR